MEQKKTRGIPLSSEEQLRNNRAQAKSSKKATKLKELQALQESDAALFQRLLEDPSKTASSKTKDVLNRMKFTEQQINRLGKGYPSSIAKAIANNKAAFSQIKRIEAALAPEFTGPINAREIRGLPFFSIWEQIRNSRYGV